MATKERSAELTTSSTDEAAAPVSAGIMAYDLHRSRLGTVMAIEGARIWLRPIGGGLEWYVTADKVRPATAAERLSPSVRAANERTRSGL